MRVRLGRGGIVALAVVGTVSLLGGLSAYDSMRSDPGEPADRSDQEKGHKAAGLSSPDGPTSPQSDSFSNASTWRRLGSDPSLVADLLSSCSERSEQDECVAGFMRDHGVKEAAVDFYRRTQSFLILFKESGEVDVGVLLDPWLANNNTRTVLLNGETPIFEPHESEPPSRVRRNPDFESAKRVFPDLDFGIQFPLTEAARRGNERSGYIFQFYLENGCHACDTNFKARVVFRFDEDGSHEGGGFLGICNSNEPVGTPAELSHIPSCPSSPRNLYPGGGESSHMHG